MAGVSSGPALAARGLTKRYAGGVLALDRLDLAIERGELVGLVGRSGAGQTTLLRLLNGALRPTAGELLVLGEPVPRLHGGALRRLRRRVATIPQGHGLVPSLTAAQNVLLGRLGAQRTLAALRALVHPTPAERGLAFAALERVGIGDCLHARADQLSAGQQQRVAVARALVQDAEVILADEPVASVDAETARVLLALFHDLSAAGRTVLVSLHQLDLARAYCPRVVALAAGRLLFDGPPADLAPVAR